MPHENGYTGDPTYREYAYRPEEESDNSRSHRKSVKKNCCLSLWDEIICFIVACFASVGRCLLLFINSVLAIFGLGTIVIATTIHFSQSISASLIRLLASSSTFMSNLTGLDLHLFVHVLHVIAKHINEMSILFLVIGCIILFTSIIGMFGISQKLLCLLWSYVVLVGGMAVAIAVCAIFISVKNNAIERKSEMKLGTLFRSNYGNNTAFTNTFNAIMEMFKCCGIENESDFRDLKPIWKNNYTQTVPGSCCKYKNGVIMDCMEAPNAQNSYVNIGCLKKIWTTIDHYRKKISIVLGIIVAILFGFVIFTCIIIKDEKRKEHRLT